MWEFPHDKKNNNTFKKITFYVYTPPKHDLYCDCSWGSLEKIYIGHYVRSCDESFPEALQKI